MRFAIFGDIHSNLEALEVVLDDAEKQGCRAYLCLGDIVGYNANPAECLARVRGLGCAAIVKGNHDEYASSGTSLDSFNPLAQAAIRWSRAQLDAHAKAYLHQLPLVAQHDAVTLVHATLDDPGDWGYVLNQLDAAASFSQQRSALCFFGHTHVPRLYVQEGGVVAGYAYQEVQLEPDRRYFVNVGSVGQPRDGDPRAAYVVYDEGARTIRLRRVAYPLERTQQKILKAGLPPKLAERLAFGR